MGKLKNRPRLSPSLLARRGSDTGSYAKVQMRRHFKSLEMSILAFLNTSWHTVLKLKYSLFPGCMKNASTWWSALFTCFSHQNQAQTDTRSIEVGQPSRLFCSFIKVENKFWLLTPTVIIFILLKLLFNQYCTNQMDDLYCALDFCRRICSLKSLFSLDWTDIGRIEKLTLRMKSRWLKTRQSSKNYHFYESLFEFYFGYKTCIIKELTSGQRGIEQL